jgi:hypothetical protein
MFTYKNQPILEIPNLISADTLAELDREMMQGLVKSKNCVHSVGKELTRGDAELSLYDFSYKCVGVAESELEPSEMEFFATLNYIEKQKYLRMAKGAYHPWSVCLPLMTPSIWPEKMKIENKVVTEEAKQLFPKTLRWAFELPIFEAIGRIVILGVDPGQHVTCHRDFDPEKWPINDEFLMLSPRGTKKFYVYDPEKKEKHYLSPSIRTYVFHDLNYHGVDALPYFTYTVRIDGIYKDEFRNSLDCNRKAPHPRSFKKQQGEAT